METKRITRNILAIFTMLAVLITTLISSGLTANANPPVADHESQRSITIWKYVLDNQDLAGDRGVGTHTQNPAGTPIGGINFEVIRVNPLPGHALTNPLIQREGVAWTRDTGFPVTVITTENNGRAFLDLGIGRSNDGIYLVRELQDPRIVRPVDPFFVHVPMTTRVTAGNNLAGMSLIYAVSVHPKNVELYNPNPRKTINGLLADSIIAGVRFTWELTANLPTDMVMHAPEDGTLTYAYRRVDGSFGERTRPVVEGERIFAQYWELRDTLDSDLLLDNAIVQVRLAGGSWTNLVLGTDFTLTINNIAITTTPVINHTNTEKAMLFALTEAGMLRIHEGNYDEVRVTLTTHVDEDFNGVIENIFNVQYLGPDWRLQRVTGEDDDTYEIPGGDDGSYSNLTEYFVGGYNLLKVNETGTRLEGAVFHIALNEEDADEGRFLASDGETYLHSETLPEGVTFVTARSGNNGVASFSGLPLTVPAGLVPGGEPWPAEEFNKTYWVVETQSPVGYELLRRPMAITVTLTSHENTTDMTEVLNRAITHLPFTGGSGVILLIGLALSALTIGTGAVAMDKRRRKA